jgi:hypothetical protein
MRRKRTVREGREGKGKEERRGGRGRGPCGCQYMAFSSGVLGI